MKLEELLYQVNENGFDVNTFSIVSAFRSPYFNKLIGNNTDLSRHVFGDAADIYIDNTKDSWMDDLNSDGNININDALILERMAAEFDRNKKYSYLAGGLSSYKSNCVRGPFIHIDTRGYHVRW